MNTLASVQCPESAKVGATRLGEFADHADCLIGVISAVRTDTTKRSGRFLVTELWVLLQEEPPPVRNVGGVNDRLQCGPVEGPT